MEPNHQSQTIYPALPCPLCDKIRPPHSLNIDGSISYICPPDNVNHEVAHTWTIHPTAESINKKPHST